MKKRLTAKDPKCFNLWRKLYDDLSDDEQFDFYDELEKLYPDQQQHQKENYIEALSKPKSIVVIEAGGWKGELAKWALNSFDSIKKWTNIEICKNAFFNQKVSNEKYSVHKEPTFRWFKQQRYINGNVFIASHMIEHLSWEDLKSLLNWCNGIETLCLEAPITELGQTWDNYVGTHKLEVGWQAIAEHLLNLGYKGDKKNKHCYYFVKQ